ncbi:MAG: ThuA domain-containing protein [Opitutaceae bacterium]|nr:ThuA domain-containing protein [Opitutaceae bacterium]
MSRVLFRHFRSVLAAGALTAATAPLALADAPAPNRAIPPAPADQAALVDAAVPAKPRVAPKKPRRVLVTARTEGFYHDSIPVGLHAFRQMGERTGAYQAEIDHEMSAFTAENLKRFDAVLFLSTTQLKFADAAARAALLDYVSNGGGVVGIHAASDNFPGWPEGQALIGGVFHSHPWISKDTVAVKLDEPAHPLNAAFGGRGFWIRDEIYQIVGPYGRDRQRVLMSLDMARPENDRPADKLVRADRDFPIGWLKKQGQGRVFYSSLGHNADVFWTPEVLQHWLDGIQFAVGDLDAPAAPSTTLSPVPAPALAPALPQTLLDLGSARADAAQAFTPANLDAVATFTDDRDRAPLHRVSAALRDPSPAARAAQRKALLGLAARKDLTPAAVAAVSDWLGDVGDDAAVPALAAWARQPASADRAIRALGRIPGAKAEAALIDLLKTAPAANRGSAAAVLGERRVAQAAKPIAGLLKSSDPREVAIALNALSRIGSKEAITSLTKFKAPAALAGDLDWALIHAARALEGDGNTGAAISLLRDLAARPSLTPPQRVAVSETRIRLEPVTALPATQPLLADAYIGPRLSRAWVLAALRAPDADKHLASLAGALASLPESMQLTLLTHADQIGDARLAPLGRTALASTTAAVRHAGFAALATCGSLDDAMTLVGALATAADRPAASAALERFQAQGLEPRLRAAVAGAAPEVHAALLLILGDRLDREAMPLMVAAASGSDKAPRAAGFSGLAALARGEDLPLVLSLRNQLQPADRRHWQEALRAAVRGRNDVPETVALLRKELEAASAAERPAFIHAIVGFDTPESTAVVRELLADADTDRRKEVIRVLAAARNQISFDLLIDVAENDADTTARTLALRGYIDTLALRTDRWTETMRAYGRAGRAALHQQDRDAAIAALGKYFGGDETEKLIAELKALPPLSGS